MTVMVLSDVPMGFGSPQVWRLASSLAAHFNTDAAIVAPAGAAPGWRRENTQLIEISLQSPVSHHLGEIEFALAAAREINRVRPRVLVVCAFLGAPALLWLKRKPPLVIYFGYEHTDGRMPRIEQVFEGIAPLIDIAIFPEEFRAALDAPRLSLEAKPITIMYNGGDARVVTVPATERNGRAFYGGLIDPDRTFGDALLGGLFDTLPLDVYGRLTGFPDPDACVAALRSRTAAVAYHGQVPADEAYAAALRQSVCALVAWNPTTESTYFACPNKFFEAIAYGVPPVCAPHPQCVRILQRYQCGWLASDFTPEALLEASRRALAEACTPAYAHKVSQCSIAADELSWNAQFKRVSEAIDMPGPGM